MRSTTGIDRMEESSTDVDQSAHQDEKDDQGDEQAHRGVSPVESEGDTDGSNNDEKGCEPVGSRMVPVSFKGGGSDPAAHPGPVPGDDLVPHHPDEARDHDDREMRDLLGMHQTIDRAVGGERCGARNDEHDRQSSEILDLAEPIRETWVGGRPLRRKANHTARRSWHRPRRAAHR
jgi:hypothetical protein